MKNHSSYQELGRSKTEWEKKIKDSNINMTEMLELSDKNFNAAMIKTLYGEIRNMLDELEEPPCSSGSQSRFTTDPDRSGKVWAMRIRKFV